MARDDLSEREREVLRLCAEGLSDKQVAAQLEISVHTVSNHIRRIVAKTGCVNRVEAVAKAVESGDVSLDSAGEDEGSPHSQSPLATPKLVSVLPSGKSSQASRAQRRSEELIGHVRTALSDPSRWHDSLLAFGRVFGSHLPMLNWTDITAPGRYSVTISPTMDPDWIHSYDTYYSRFAPSWEAIRHAGGDFFAASDDIQVEPELRQGPFDREYRQPLDIAHAVAWTVFLDRTWAVTLFLAQGSGHGPTTLEEREIGTIVFPHIRHAFRRLWLAAGSHEPAALAETGAGSLVKHVQSLSAAAVILNEEGSLLLANHRGEKVLRSGRWLRLDNSQLVGTTPAETMRLNDVIRRSTGRDEHAVLTSAPTLIMRSVGDVATPARITVFPLHTEEICAPGSLKGARTLLTLEPLLATPV